jgi:biotin carboxyl carrier protein
VKLNVTIDGKVYEVEVEASEPTPERPTLSSATTAPATAASPSSAPKPANGAPVADEAKVCRSPIAGIVVKVSAQAGQAIQANDVLVVLEAMKMETTIPSPVAGKIAKVLVGNGDSVQAGQVLIEFE